MRKIIIFALSALCLASCAGKDPVYWFNPSASSATPGSQVPYYPSKPSGQESGTLPTDGHAPSGYALVWNDEFNSQVNLYSNWTFETGGHGWGNQEEQFYCSGGYYDATGQYTASVSDGSLKITAYKLYNAPYPGNNCHYISTRMNTKDSWQYGYIEMRAKLPVKLGCWSAFWMLLKDGPSYVRDASQTGAEIDIMEHVPSDGVNSIYFSAHSYNATGEAGRNTGYTDPVTHKLHPYCQSSTVSDATAWHCYGMEWTHEYIKGFIDGQMYFYAPNPTPNVVDMATWPFDQEFYLKLNLAVGGSWGGTPASDFDAETYEIDWVRVYQKTNTSPVTEPTVSDKLAAHQWSLTEVKEEGVSVTTSTGNLLTLNSDHTLAFNCVANGGQTFDHTWEGSLIAPNTYGEVSGMNWYTYTDNDVDYLGVTNGFLLVFVQDNTDEAIYRIEELTDTNLTVSIVTYDETWTLLFEAV